MQRVEAVALADLGFEPGHVDAGVRCHFARGDEALLERRQGVRVLERIARGDEPPDAVEAEPFQRQQARGAMARVRRIERTAEQADLHASRMRRQPRRPW